MTNHTEGDASVVIAGILSWIVNPNATKHCTITGGPGAGKSHMIKEMVETYNRFKDLKLLQQKNPVPLTVTCGTNDSCKVVSDMMNLKPATVTSPWGISAAQETVGTFHTHLGFTVRNKRACFRRGNKFFFNDPHREKEFQPITETREILIADEANYINTDVFALLEEFHPNVRVIFIGSQHQLGSDEGESPIFKQGYDSFLLNTKWRAGNADVQAVYDHTEKDVINGTYSPILDNPSLVYLTEEDWYETMRNAYTSPKNLSVVTLAYTNKRVFELVGIIRAMKGLEGMYDIHGPRQALIKHSRIPKTGCTIKTSNDGDYISVGAGNSRTQRSYIANSMDEFKWLSNKANQNRAFEINPALVASMEARTVHGAQGSTYDYVFLDLRDIAVSRRFSLETFRRLTHVGQSRQTTKIYALA